MPKILIIRLSSIGDIFHTFTLLPDIRKAVPGAQIDWLVDSNFTGIAELSPLIDNVISIPLRQWKKNKFLWLFKLLNFKNKLAQVNYDYIIDTQGLIKSAILAKYLFNGKVYGLDFNSAREPMASWFYDYKYSVNQNSIAVIRLRGLIAEIFSKQTDLSKIDFKVKQNNYKIESVTGYVVFLHGTSKNNKKWPLENWLNLAKWLNKYTNKDIILSYSNLSEQKFAEDFSNFMNSNRIILLPKLDFLSLTTLLAQADLVIGVDTGFTHMANLLGRPTLAIYLHSNPNYVGMLQSTIAHNFGGLNTKVEPQELINYICKQQLLKVT